MYSRFGNSEAENARSQKASLLAPNLSPPTGLRDTAGATFLPYPGRGARRATAPLQGARRRHATGYANGPGVAKGSSSEWYWHREHLSLPSCFHSSSNRRRKTSYRRHINHCDSSIYSSAKSASAAVDCPGPCEVCGRLVPVSLMTLPETRNRCPGRPDDRPPLAARFRGAHAGGLVLTLEKAAGKWGATTYAVMDQRFGRSRAGAAGMQRALGSTDMQRVAFRRMQAAGGVVMVPPAISRNPTCVGLIRCSAVGNVLT
jgi:hypothetical protein